MMALGLFVFSLETVAYQEMQRQTQWRHATSSRIGAREAHQYIGPGSDGITLPGVLLPQFAGSRMSLDVLRQMANTGQAWVLVDGVGRVYGAWIIEQISEGHSLFFSDGAPRRIEFSISLKRIDDDLVDISSVLGNLASGLGAL